MKPIASRLDLDYPIYLYSELPDFKNIPSGELHLLINSIAGYCNGIHCSNCPIQKECESDSAIVQLFPQLKETHPEYFI